MFSVFIKEIKVIFRDKKTFIFGILLPLFLLPAMMALLHFSSENLKQNAERPVSVCINDTDNSFYKDCVVKNGMNVQNENGNTNAVEESKIDANIIIPQDFDEKILNGEHIDITIQTNNESNYSSGAVSKLQGYVKRYKSDILKQQLEKKGLPENIVNQISVVNQDISENKQNHTNNLMAILIPMFLVLYCCIGSSSTAADLSAGEKEKYTLEPLLSTSIQRTKIIFGKLFATSVVGIISALCAVLGLFISCHFFMAGVNLSLSTIQILLMLIITILTAIVFAAINLSVGVYSRSYKEAQTYLTAVSLLCILPSILANTVAANKIPIMFLNIPILNMVSVMKEIIMGTLNYSHIFILVGWFIVYISVSLIIARRLFQSEKVVFRV